MLNRQQFLDHLWENVINSPEGEQALDNIIANCKRDPDGPFGDMGAAIERLLEAGVSMRDLRLVFRGIAYEAVFGTLYALGDPGLKEDEAAASLHEDLLTSDPSGMEGRPGFIDKF